MLNCFPPKTWTLECIDALASPQVFSVFGSESGRLENATVGTQYTSEFISFKILAGTVPFDSGDQFTFTTDTFWRVTGTVSGVQENTAITGQAYVSDNNQVAFTIIEGTEPFAINDYFAFTTTAAATPYWLVEGSESGLQAGLARAGSVYTSDNEEVSFLIQEGTVPFVDGDTFTFRVTRSPLTYGTVVWDLVRVAGTHGGAAILYAATNTGVFRSDNGGRTWRETGNFTGDFVTCLFLHPASAGGAADILYAGTQNGGVWVSTDSGVTWVRDPTGMPTGASIKDILADPANALLYAIDYQGPVDAATSHVYVHALNAAGGLAADSHWRTADTGLTGQALHALASDIPQTPTKLTVGGEGIHLYQSTSGLTTGTPSWASSKAGFTNELMARIPILFSGPAVMSVQTVYYENIVFFTIYIQDVNGNPPIEGSTFTATYEPESGDTQTWYDIEYSDAYTYQGTFRDPGNGHTNNPFRASAMVSPGDKVEFVFTPANTLPDVPGSSGSNQTLTFNF
jgi:hypothetical protein